MSQSRRGSNPGSSGKTPIILGPISTYSCPGPRPPPFASVESPWSSLRRDGAHRAEPASTCRRRERRRAVDAGDAREGGGCARRERGGGRDARKKGEGRGRWARRRAEEARAEMRTRPPTLEHDRDSREAAMVVIIARQVWPSLDPIRTRHAIPSGWQAGATAGRLGSNSSTAQLKSTRHVATK